jgi:hypothetical protein
MGFTMILSSKEMKNINYILDKINLRLTTIRSQNFSSDIGVMEIINKVVKFNMNLSMNFSGQIKYKRKRKISIN